MHYANGHEGLVYNSVGAIACSARAERDVVIDQVQCTMLEARVASCSNRVYCFEGQHFQHKYCAGMANTTSPQSFVLLSFESQSRDTGGDKSLERAFLSLSLVSWSHEPCCATVNVEICVFFQMEFVIAPM